MAKKRHIVTALRAIFIVGCAIAAAVITFFTGSKSNIANWEAIIGGALLGGALGLFIWLFMQNLIAEED